MTILVEFRLVYYTPECWKGSLNPIYGLSALRPIIDRIHLSRVAARVRCGQTHVAVGAPHADQDAGVIEQLCRGDILIILLNAAREVVGLDVAVVAAIRVAPIEDLRPRAVGRIAQVNVNPIQADAAVAAAGVVELVQDQGADPDLGAQVDDLSRAARDVVDTPVRVADADISREG